LTDFTDPVRPIVENLVLSKKEVTELGFYNFYSGTGVTRSQYRATSALSAVRKKI